MPKMRAVSHCRELRPLEIDEIFDGTANVRFWHLADMASATANVRCWRQSGHPQPSRLRKAPDDAGALNFYPRAMGPRHPRLLFLARIVSRIDVIDADRRSDPLGLDDRLLIPRPSIVCGLS
jgi:hypothetical protein